MKKFFAFALFLVTLPLLSSCSAIEYPASREQVLESVAYNPGGGGEWIFWLAVPYGSAELGMVRVPADKVSVCLRNDCADRTTVRFSGYCDGVRRRYGSAVIIASDYEDFCFWTNKLKTGR